MPPKNDKLLLLDQAATNAAIAKVAAAIVGEFPTAELAEIALLGIQLRGVPFARRLARLIHGQTGANPLVGALDISMYRDDIGIRKAIHAVRETEIPFDLNGRKIVLVDDVLYTGRTIRAALDAITDYGRPELIRLAVLVDRGWREYPICADYTGANCPAPPDRKVEVMLAETDREDAVYEKAKKER